jgi:hypothetical protein
MTAHKPRTLIDDLRVAVVPCPPEFVHQWRAGLALFESLIMQDTSYTALPIPRNVMNSSSKQNLEVPQIHPVLAPNRAESKSIGDGQGNYVA